MKRFAAVVGHDKAVEEVSRHTEVRRELDDCEKERINSQLQLVLDNIDKAPYVKITCFIPDGNKAGGEYRTMEGRVKKILPLLKKLVLTDDREIIIEDIIKIETEI